MGNACSIEAHRAGGAQQEAVLYTDEQAEIWAREAGVNPRPMETKSEIDSQGRFHPSAQSADHTLRGRRR